MTPAHDLRCGAGAAWKASACARSHAELDLSVVQARCYCWLALPFAPPMKISLEGERLADQWGRPWVLVCRFDCVLWDVAPGG